MDNNSIKPMGESNPEVVPVKSLVQIKKELNSLIGLRSFKEEMALIENLANTQKLESNLISKPQLHPYHYIFTIDTGCGLTTILNIMAQVFYNYKIINSIKVEERQLGGFYLFSPRYEKSDDIGIIALHDIESFFEDRHLMDDIISDMCNSDGKKVIILVLPRSKTLMAKSLLNSVKLKAVCKHLDFSPYETEEFAKIGQGFLSSYNYELSKNAKDKFCSIIEEVKTYENFSNIHTIKSIIQDIRMKKVDTLSKSKLNSSTPNTIESEDVILYILPPSKKSKAKEKIKNVKENLENMVGLEGIKSKIEDIASILTIEKKLKNLGIDIQRSCFHMLFTGNPGTGKTTAARLVGQYFKDLGLLEKGNFHEVSRSDLIGKYMGHTAALTKNMIEEARGSVLFIDEAYSLVIDERDIYGIEALATLVAEMENNRDNMVIILAGYTKELNEMISKIGIVMINRIRRILKVAIENNQRAIVLGAFGCGVFKNSPLDLVNYYKQILITEDFKDYFNKITFAIYDNTIDKNILNQFKKLG